LKANNRANDAEPIEGRDHHTIDAVIRNGTIIDGTGLPDSRGDIGIKNGLVAKIGKSAASAGAKLLDESSLVVAPDFVDFHTHYDATDPLGSLLLDFELAWRDLGRDRQLWFRLCAG